MFVDEEGCDCREVVEKWLYVDSNEFQIPATDWGRDLKDSLEHVLALAQSIQK